MKFILLLLAIALLLWMLFGRSRGSRGAPPRDSGERDSKQPEGMVACAHCGVHLPRSEALALGQFSYCSAAHRDAGPRDGA